MDEVYELQNLEQLRAISDALRVSILRILRERPMTTKQLGDHLEMAPAKVHYHVRELEKVGLVQLVETREKGGILEKYYQPIAHSFSVPKEMLLAGPPDDMLASAEGMLDDTKAGFLRGLRQAVEQKNERANVLLRAVEIYATYEEQKRLYEQIFALLAPYEQRRDQAGETLHSVFMLYPAPSTSQPEQQSRKVAESAQIYTESPQSDAVLSKSIVGVAHYNKADLEQILGQGQRLQLFVVGACLIATDVSAELADRAIEKLKLIGKLEAAPAVRKVLEAKRS